MLVCLGLALLLPAITGATTTPVRPQTVFDFTPELDHGLLGQGRQAYRERKDHQRGRDAYRYFKRYVEEHPDDPVGAWHFSLSCYYMGVRVLQDSEKKKVVYLEGRKAVDHVLSQHSDCGPCHLLSAINHALWAKEVGIIRALVGLPTVKRHLNRAVELDPEFGGAAPYRIQATIFQALPRILGGGKARSRDAIQKAIEVAPYEPLNYEFLAWLLLMEYDDRKGALEVSIKGLAVPRPGDEYLESLDALDWMQKVVDVFGPKYGLRTESGG